MIPAKLHPEIAPLFSHLVAACDPPMETLPPQQVRAIMDGFHSAPKAPAPTRW